MDRAEYEASFSEADNQDHADSDAGVRSCGSCGGPVSGCDDHAEADVYHVSCMYADMEPLRRRLGL